MAAMVATEDQYVLACSILRKRKTVHAMSERLLRKDVNEPSGITAAYGTVKQLLMSWNESKKLGQPMFYDLPQYNAMSQLAIWTVQKFHEINGTPIPNPENLKLWPICFQDAGAQSLKDTGLLV